MSKQLTPIGVLARRYAVAVPLGIVLAMMLKLVEYKFPSPPWEMQRQIVPIAPPIAPWPATGPGTLIEPTPLRPEDVYVSFWDNNDVRMAFRVAASATAAASQSAWVKLCEKAPVLVKGKDGKEYGVDKSICLTHHERVDGDTGMVLVSAAIREVEGQDKKHLMVMVPLGMAIQPGLRAKIYDKAIWDAAQKNEKVDDSKLEVVKLNYSLCHPAGCTAEIDLTPEIMQKINAGAGIMVFSINANGQVIAFPVPLNGFGGALAGAPIENSKYVNKHFEARRLLGQQWAIQRQGG